MNRSVKDIAWLAGLLEGEGCFRIRENGTTAQIKVSMTDKDIMVRIKSIMLSKNDISTDERLDRPNCKTIYSYSLNGSKAIQWMMTIYPLMGKRRQAKIKEIFSLWKSYNGERNSRGHFYGDRCRRNHLIVGHNAIKFDFGRHRCKLCNTSEKNMRKEERNKIIKYLEEKEKEMPVKSSKQWRLMAAIAHGKTPTKKGIGGLTKSTAKEFIKKTPKKKRTMFASK